MNDKQDPVLVCKDLCISYYTRAGEIPAVINFSSMVKPGETIGIGGESECGKSTFAKVLMELEPGTEREIRHNGKSISDIEVRDHSTKQIRSLQLAQELKSSIHANIGESLIFSPFTKFIFDVG